MDDDLKRIAARIRTWRNDARLTLQQLGDRSGVSASTVHKIENLQTVPAIAVLLKVAHGVARRPSELLAEIEAGEQVAILRRDDRPRAQLGERGQIEHLIGRIPRSQLEVWRVRLEPADGFGIPGSEPRKFQGGVALIVEEGTLEAVVGEETYELVRGDSMHFDASVPHRWYASGGKPAMVLVTANLPDRIHADLATRIARATTIHEDPCRLNA